MSERDADFAAIVVLLVGLILTALLYLSGTFDKDTTLHCDGPSHELIWDSYTETATCEKVERGDRGN